MVNLAKIRETIAQTTLYGPERAPEIFAQQLAQRWDIDILPYVVPEGGALDIDACPDCWERRAHIERYEYACRHLSRKRVLDFGCGVGYGSEMLALAGNEVIAADTSVDALRRAGLRRGDRGILFTTPREDFPPFDAVMAFEVIEHLEDPRAFFRALAARELFCSVPVIPTVGRNPYHRTDFTIEGFEALCREFGFLHTLWHQTRPFASCPTYAVFHLTRR